MNQQNIQYLVSLSDGNPGAATFMVEFLKPDNFINSISILTKIERCPTIRGSNLYILWNDLAERDFNKVTKLCEKCPDNILEDACSRQDRSGKELISEYLN
jgi:hypothetical protein